MNSTIFEQYETVSHLNKSSLNRIPVSNSNVFEDELWEFFDEENERYLAIDNAKLRIDWGRWREHFGSSLIYDMKVFTIANIRFSSIFAKSSHVQNKGYKANTVLEKVKKVLRLFEGIVLDFETNPQFSTEWKIHSIDELSFDVLKIALEKENSDDGTTLIKTLSDMANPTIFHLYESEPRWTREDLNQIIFYKERNQREVKGAIKDDYFLFLTNQATADVLTFLDRLNIPHVPIENEGKHYSKQLIRDDVEFTSVFDEYCKWRLKNKGYQIKKYVAPNYFYKKFNIHLFEILKIVTRVQRAAMYLVLQYTGARYSEGASFTIDSLDESTAIPVLYGTVIKFQDARKLTYKDEWVATPIVINSVRALKKIAEFTMNPYLLSNTQTVWVNKKAEPLSNGGINSALNSYVDAIDPKGIYNIKKENWLTVHRLRHTLAKNLAKAKLNLPYISYHLKHVHQSIAQYQQVNNTTLSYGNIGNELFTNITAVQEARREVVMNIYHPDSTIIGGKSEELKERRTHYFNGMMEAGWEEDEIIDYITSSGVPLIDVGLGYCGKDEDDTEDVNLPCIGQLKCNPVNCPNAIIPESHKDKWLAIYKQNLELMNNTELTHFKEHYELAMNEAKQVLLHLGEVL